MKYAGPIAMYIVLAPLAVLASLIIIINVIQVFSATIS